MMRTALSMPFIDRSSDLQASLRSYQPMLPSSRMVSQCMGSALVPAYRCGSVPDFHRIPY